MSYTTRDIQARLAALGYQPGQIDGMMGPKTRTALAAALRARSGRSAADLFHHSGLHRIHLHWTAGADGVIDLERHHYNGIVDRAGNRWDGKYRFEAQARYQIGSAASHTLNANTGAIGLAADAMGGAVERPFDPGPCPLTWPQLRELAAWTAELCVAYDIPVTKWSVLTHAEVQQTLGIRQRNKWDYMWLPDMDAPGDAIAVGDRLRAMVIEQMQSMDLAA